MDEKLPNLDQTQEEEVEPIAPTQTLVSESLLRKKQHIWLAATVLILVIISFFGLMMLRQTQKRQFPKETTNIKQSEVQPASTSESKQTSENVKPIPRANVLIVIKDEDGKLVEDFTVRVEFVYEQSYYNFDYDVIIKDNPTILELMPPEDGDVKLHILKYGYEPLEVTGINGHEFWSKLQTLPENGIQDEVLVSPDITRPILDKVIVLAQDAVMLRTGTLKKIYQVPQTYDYQRYSDKLIFQLYATESDVENSHIVGRWNYLKNKYPDSLTYIISKTEADKLLGNDNLIKLNESFIRVYKHGYNDALYYGEQIVFDKFILNSRVFGGENGFSNYESKIDNYLNKVTIR